MRCVLSSDLDLDALEDLAQRDELGDGELDEMKAAAASFAHAQALKYRARKIKSCASPGPLLVCLMAIPLCL